MLGSHAPYVYIGSFYRHCAKANLFVLALTASLTIRKQSHGCSPTPTPHTQKKKKKKKKKRKKESKKAKKANRLLDQSKADPHK